MVEGKRKESFRRPTCRTSLPSIIGAGNWMERQPYHSYHQQSSDREMGLRDLLSPPRMYRRARSEGRSEVGSIEDAGQACPVISRHAKSTPDLGIGSSTLSTPRPSTSQDHGSNSTQTTLSWIVCPTTFVRATQVATLPIGSDQFSGQEKAKTQDQKNPPRIKVRWTGKNQT